MKNNRPPKLWAVKNDGSQLFKDTVVEFLNANYNAQYDGECMGNFYGVIGGTPFCSCEVYPAEVLTLQEFISLTSEEDVRENEWDFREGDVLIRNFVKIKILGICGVVVFISLKDDFCKTSGYIFTKEEIYKNGWRLYKEEPKKPEIIEVTIEEIAKLKGVDVSQIRIKDDKKESN